MGIILSEGQIVTPGETIKADIRIEGEVIQAIGKNIKSEKNDEVINVKGCYILPGGVETHTHFYLGAGASTTADDFKTGTLAAIIGGTTTILDFATQERGKTLEEALDIWHEKADNVSFCDYGFHMAITDWNEQTSKSMENMIKNGISSFKMYMAYKGTLQVNDSEIYEALKRSAEVNGIIGFHCENGDIIDELVKENIKKGLVQPKYHEKSRPSILEAEAISRVSKIASIAKAPLYVVHLSSKEGYKEALKARENGVDIYLETCPQYLLLDKSKYEGTKKDSFDGAKYIMSPPLRNKEDNEVLWKGIESDDIKIIGTDHCSFTYEQKKKGINDFSKIPNGGPGVEHRILLMYQYGVVEKRFSINKLSEIVSTNAAKMFGMYPKKGIIKCGSDADLIVLNPNKSFIITNENQHQNLDYTFYNGYKIDCNIDYVFLRGKNIVKDNKLVESMAKGKYVKRNCFKTKY